MYSCIDSSRLWLIYFFYCWFFEHCKKKKRGILVFRLCCLLTIYNQFINKFFIWNASLNFPKRFKWSPSVNFNNKTKKNKNKIINYCTNVFTISFTYFSWKLMPWVSICSQLIINSFKSINTLITFFLIFHHLQILYIMLLLLIQLYLPYLNYVLCLMVFFIYINKIDVTKSKHKQKTQ